MSVPEPGDALAITITLHRPDGRPFVASVRGVAPGGRPLRGRWRAALRHPFETWVIRALITAHGIRLWRKGLPVQPRPPHCPTMFARTPTVPRSPTDSPP